MLEKPTILVAEDLTPSQFLSLDLKNLAGMILEKTGRTSHTLILARASAIPVLSGLPLDAIARYAGNLQCLTPSAACWRLTRMTR